MGFTINKNLEYKLLKQFYIEEEKIEGYELCHKKTNAKIILFCNNDNNKVFNIAFKTKVINDKGIPHILEHSVLCGSKKYDVKDPFMELAKGSLNTFLNALTFSDKTCYPVASTNIYDLKNLIDVYLDAVFFPNILKTDKLFKQEGWHYEIDNITSDLKVNGIVYNEMKGVYSNPENLMEGLVCKSLFESSNYGYESGGTPEEIINLTYEEYLDFYKEKYHPSNAIIYLYGDMDMNDMLTYIDEEYLSKFDIKNINDNSLPYKDVPKNEFEYFYNNIDTNYENKNYISYNFSLHGNKDSLINILDNIIIGILFDMESSLIKEKLLEKGLGEDVYTIYDNGMEKGFLSIVSQNIDNSKKDLFFKTIDDEINNILSNGISKNKFDAIKNMVHFRCCEKDSNMPHGLILSIESLSTYLYDGCIDTYLKYKREFEIIDKIDINDLNNILYKRIRELFVDNKYKTKINLIPKFNLNDEKEKELNLIMKQRKENFIKTNQIENIIKDTKELKEFQSKEDSLDKLKSIPLLKVSDIDKERKYLDYETFKIFDKDVIATFSNTQGIDYIGIRFLLDNLTDNELAFVSILIQIIGKIDTLNYNYSDFEDFIGVNLGGFDIKIDIFEDKKFLCFNLKCFDNKLAKAYEILYEAITNTVIKMNDRIKNLFNKIKLESNMSILSQGHIASMNRTLSNLSNISKMVDITSINGIAFNYLINVLVENLNNDFNGIVEYLKFLYDKIVNVNKMSFDVLIEKENLNNYINETKIFIDKISNKFVSKEIYVYNNVNINNYIRTNEKEVFVSVSDVNYVARGCSFNKDQYGGILQILKTILSYDYLWNNIRVLGGAYGCAFTALRDGSLCFVSFRDPNLINTDNVYKNVKKYFSNLNLSKRDIDKYIIGTMGREDRPNIPFIHHKENLSNYYNNIDNKLLNKERLEILNFDNNKLKEIINIFDNINITEHSCAVISKKSEEEAKINNYKIFNLKG